MSEIRPQGYRYYEMLMDHLKNDESTFFNGQVVYPRQLEIHLPADHKQVCNFHCSYCQGHKLEQPLADYEFEALALLQKIEGRIPYHIYGGAYTEPLLNPYMLDFLYMTKQYKNSFGIHTNGSMLLGLEEEHDFLSELMRIGTDKTDYLSISLDAGTTESHCKTKGLLKDWFSEILEGIRCAVKLRGTSKYPAIRVCYLLNKYNSSDEELNAIVNFAKETQIDSLRFSIPYDIYGKDFADVEKYRDRVEITWAPIIEKSITPLVSQKQEKPFIFYLPPENQDIHRMDFKHCIYSYYQITIGADGNIYRCSSTASPSFPANRLGPMTSDLTVFEDYIVQNHNKTWQPATCFKVGGRCNRMALEINNHYHKGVDNDTR